MKQLVVLSGKGGTGKTSLLASFVRLAGRAIAIDCDVDAANLGLLLTGEEGERHDFFAGRRAKVLEDRCALCGRCLEVCRYDALRMGQGRVLVDRLACEGCGACARACPQEAIVYEENLAGEWWVRALPEGQLVHARLGIAQDNSGKLVAQLRKVGRELAEQQGHELVLIDGPPGIGCPVHASISGADAMVAVTEPSAAGEHDLERLLRLAARFRVPAGVVINRFDLAPEASDRIERLCGELALPLLGRIPFDPLVPRLQSRGELPLAASLPTARAVRESWEAARRLLLGTTKSDTEVPAQGGRAEAQSE